MQRCDRTPACPHSSRLCGQPFFLTDSLCRLTPDTVATASPGLLLYQPPEVPPFRCWSCQVPRLPQEPQIFYPGHRIQRVGDWPFSDPPHPSFGPFLSSFLELDKVLFLKEICMLQYLQWFCWPDWTLMYSLSWKIKILEAEDLPILEFDDFLCLTSLCPSPRHTYINTLWLKTKLENVLRRNEWKLG